MTHEVLVGCQPYRRSGEGKVSTCVWCGTGREPFMIDTKKALEVAQYPWRVEQGGRYSLPSMDEVGYVVGTIQELADEVELLRKQNWQARQKIGTLEQETDRVKKESEDYWRSACHWKKESERLHKELKRRVWVKGVSHEDE